MGNEDRETSFVFNHYDPRFQDDPYPIYERLRSSEPIHKTIFNTWVVTAYAHADAILKDPRFEIDNLPERIQKKAADYQEESFLQLAELLEHWLFFANPPEHSRLKKGISPSFTQEATEKLRPFIADLAETIFARFTPTGRIDIIQDLVDPLTASTITRFMGFEETDVDRLSQWCGKTIDILDQPVTLETYRELAVVIAEFRGFLKQKLASFREQTTPPAGLFAWLISQQQGDVGLTDEEIISATIMLVTAQESVKGLMGNGVLALAQQTDHFDELVKNPSLLQAAVEELLRYDSSIQYVARRAAQDVQFADKLIKKGDYIVIYLGAANRDPDAFPQPNEVNFHRTKKNLSFGGGIHYCVGSNLARLEMEIALQSLTRHVSKIQLATDTLTRYESRVSRRLKSLPILLMR
jgi:pimeloyl-[acyl-carrier protein] synthase